MTYPKGVTAQANDHINVKAISCADYRNQCGSYLNQGANWNIKSFNIHMDNPTYVGKSYVDWGNAGRYSPNAYDTFGGAYCVVWVQVSGLNQHFGEDGSMPVCTGC
jgi:hypothetical protein